jgi:hypothetical protein
VSRSRRLRKRRRPRLIRKISNLAKATIKHINDNMTIVTTDQYEERISICSDCSLREKDECTHPSCGCVISRKAWWRSEDCPEEKWPKL